MAIDRRFTMEHKRKIGLALRGNKNFLGKKHSELSKRKISETRKRLYAEGKLTTWNKGLTKKVDSRLAKVSRISSRPKTLKHRQRIGEAHRKLWANPKYKETHIQPAIENAKLQWQNPEFRKMHEEMMANGCLKKMLMALNKRPTKLEKQFMVICDKYGLPFEYVGDGDFFVGSKNPDFIHTNGDKVCVEVANTYSVHHSKDYPTIRKKYFAEHGWDCIVFMGNKLDETVVLSELRGVG